MNSYLKSIFWFPLLGAIFGTISSVIIIFKYLEFLIDPDIISKLIIGIYCMSFLAAPTLTFSAVNAVNLKLQINIKTTLMNIISSLMAWALSLKIFIYLNSIITATRYNQNGISLMKALSFICVIIGNFAFLYGTVPFLKFKNR